MAPNGHHSFRNAPGFSGDAFDDDIAREIAFNELRANAPLSAAYDTIRSRSKTPLPLHQFVGIAFVWILLALSFAAWTYVVADGELRFLSGACPAVVVHYVVVGTVLLFSAIWFAYHNCNWYKQIAARNDHLKPSRFADSALFGGYISGAGLQQQDSQGFSVHWNAYLERQSDRGCCNKGRLSCCIVWTPRVLLGFVLLVGLWNFAVAVGWSWLLQATEQSTIDSSTIEFKTQVPLSAPVSLKWEQNGMVHVKADTEADLFFGQGFVSAQLRLWEMVMQRALANGRLSELVGAAALPMDKLFRTLGLKKAASRAYAALDEHTREAIQAYTAGVNAYLVRIGIHLKDVEPWAAADCLAMAKVMAFELSGNMPFELRRYALLLRGLDHTRIQQLMPPYDAECSDIRNGTCQDRGGADGFFPTVLQPHDCPRCGGSCCAPWTNPPPLSSKGIVEDVQPSMAVSSMIHEQNKYAQDLRETKEKALVQALRATLANRTRNPLWQNRSAWPTRTGLLAGFGPLGQQGRWAHLLGGQGSSISEANSHAPHLGASNNWVVDGQFTTTGRPLLANDPHLTMTAPAVWMLIHLESPSYSAIGSALAGTPFVVIGKNSKVGWGVTNTGVDVQDLYIIEEQSAHSYKLDGKPEKYKNYRTEIIKVKGDKDVRFPVKETVFGPVITGVLDQITRATEVEQPKRWGPHPLALRWVAIDPTVNDTTLQAFYKLGKASDWSSFRDALELMVCPSQNFVFADSVTGTVGYQLPGKIPIRSDGHTGEYPAIGNSTKYDWKGYVPYNQLPRTDEGGPESGYVVSANNKVTPANYDRVLTHDWDSGSSGYRARRISKMLSAAIEGGTKLSMHTMRNIQLDTHSGLWEDIAMPILHDMDTKLLTSQGRVAYTALTSWSSPGDMRVGSPEASLFALWCNQLMKLVQNETGEEFWPNWAFLRSALLKGDRICNSVGGCDAFAARALSAAGAEYERKGRPEWGREVHHAKFKHAILDQTIGGCLGDRVAPHGGDMTTVNVGHYDPSDPNMVQTAGPSYRQLLDLADGGVSTASNPGSLFISPIGQSGNPLSHHYADSLPSWEEGDYWFMQTTGFRAEHTQTLKPKAVGK